MISLTWMIFDVADDRHGPLGLLDFAGSQLVKVDLLGGVGAAGLHRRRAIQAPLGRTIGGLKILSRD